MQLTNKIPIAPMEAFETTTEFEQDESKVVLCTLIL